MRQRRGVLLPALEPAHRHRLGLDRPRHLGPRPRGLLQGRGHGRLRVAVPRQLGVRRQGHRVRARRHDRQHHPARPAGAVHGSERELQGLQDDPARDQRRGGAVGSDRRRFRNPRSTGSARGARSTRRSRSRSTAGSPRAGRSTPTSPGRTPRRPAPARGGTTPTRPTPTTSATWSPRTPSCGARIGSWAT